MPPIMPTTHLLLISILFLILVAWMFIFAWLAIRPTGEKHVEKQVQIVVRARRTAPVLPAVTVTQVPSTLQARHTSPIPVVQPPAPAIVGSES